MTRVPGIQSGASTRAVGSQAAPFAGTSRFAPEFPRIYGNTVERLRLSLVKFSTAVTEFFRFVKPRMAYLTSDGRVRDFRFMHPDVAMTRTVSMSHTISSGKVTLPLSGPPTRVILRVEGEGAAADSLDTIAGTRKGDEVIVHIKNASNDITLTESGNLRIGATFTTFVLGELQDLAILINIDGSNLDATTLRNN